MKLDNRIWVLITVVLCGALLAGGWFVGVSPQLTNMATTASQRATVKVDNDGLRAQIASLAEAKENMPALTAQLESLKSAIPSRVSGSSFVASLDQIAAASSSTLTSFTLSEPIGYAPLGTAPEDAPSPASDDSISASNFVIVPIQATVSGSDAAVTDFLARLQNASRLVLITDVQKTVDDAESGSVSLSVGGAMFVLSDEPIVSEAEAAEAEAEAGAAAAEG